jgi:uncharacterized protein (UPF0332 family)
LIPKDLLAQADHLFKLSPKRPKQANLRRAVSASYYAVFHALCWSNANVLVGTGTTRPQRAWLQAYRAVDHGQAKARCKETSVRGFPATIQAFAESFVTLQEYRHRADYSPDQHFTKQEVSVIVGLARSAVTAMSRAPSRDRRAFAIHVLLNYRSKSSGG